MNTARNDRQDSASNTMQPQPHFLRLPAELRNIIYSHLLVAPPVRHIECGCAYRPLFTDQEHSVTENGFLASTCHSQPSSIRTVGVLRLSSDVHTAILRVNKLCHREGVAVLYENTQILMRQPMPFLHVSQDAMQHTGRLHLAYSAMSISEDLIAYAAYKINNDLPNIRVVSLHIDVDFALDESINPTDFQPLLTMDTELVSFVIDLHVTAAWDSDKFMQGMIIDREEDEEAAEVAEYEAFRMRGKLIEYMEQWAREAGKRFKVLEG
ncbi:hypothetical protein DOTSEDRAFT_56260 [Dothistroma septosporum NZE10]|uniref:F-box domain-containing protein n=1 Tax=Dothistroma septosporum (strain NZE10 / CBS 128990) TaxID=675120 RepID=N1PC06_DOTSN|nr:hypothetical protein DOTSEDRAFT_56260 [Dothistroma septosporum NZE10]